MPLAELNLGMVHLHHDTKAERKEESVFGVNRGFVWARLDKVTYFRLAQLSRNPELRICLGAVMAVRL